MEASCFNILNNYKPVLLVILLGTVGSCNVIFEEDITDKTVEVIIPSNNDTISSNQVHFKWNELYGATFYNLQIVQPSFDDISTFVLDSNISELEFYYPLNPGEYEFQIRGENAAYKSMFSGPFRIVIDSVSDLSSSVVPLLSPTDDYYSNATNFSYSWLQVFSADYYEFQLRSGNDFESSSTILYSATDIYSTSYSTPDGLYPTEGEYAWGVKAHNTTSSTDFSGYTIFIDRTNPNDPLASSPAHGSSFADTVVMKWDAGVDPGTINSPITAYIEIGADTLFTSLLTTYEVSDADSVQHVFTSIGTYWWRVYLEDEAGNISDYYSEHRKVVIE